MKVLNFELLQEFLKVASKDLQGEWLLVGGTLLPAVGLMIRSTVDIDLVGLGEREAAQNLELMSVAEKLGLSVETINQAAAYFLQKVGYTRKDLIILKKGKSATIFRPSVRLYWKLKLARLTESDMLDCQHYLSYCRGQGDTLDRRELEKLLATQKRDDQSFGRAQRLLILKDLLTTLP
jgi:hypothetical protein